MQLVLLDVNAKHLTLLGKSADRNIAHFVATLKRNSPALNNNWTFSTATARFDLLSATTQLSTIPSEDLGVLFMTYIYFLVHECFVVPFSESDLQKLKLYFAYWLAIGNLPI